MAQHEHGGRVCEYPTKKACEAARRDAMGRCTELTKADKTGQTSCSNWAVERVNDRGVCGQHYEAMLTREREAERTAATRAVLTASIDSYIAGEPERIAAVRSWWRAQATPSMRTSHALLLLRADMRPLTP